MQIIKQEKFNEFNCIAEKCPESCCKFWQIYADEDSLKKYKSLAGSDRRVFDNTDFDKGCFKQTGGICGFLDTDELCYLQKNYGEDILCDTCGNFPRHVEEFENVREYSLSLSCPEAARILLTSKEPLRFTEEEDGLEEEFEDFDCLLYDVLVDVREFLYEIAKDRKIPLFSRLHLIYEFGIRYQKYLEDGYLFEWEDIKESIEKERCRIASEPDKTITVDKKKERKAFNVLYGLEYLHEDWPARLYRTEEMLFSDCENLPSGFDRFQKEYETAGEKILVLFLFTYFCGAVYDGWAFSKICLAIYSVKWICYIAFSAGASDTSLLKTAWQYAREIEHSDENLNRLEEWFVENEYN